MQNVALVHDTPVRAAESMVDALPQVVPWCRMAWSVESTAAQKLAVGQDRAVRLPPVSMVPGADQLEAAAIPEPSARKAIATPAPAAKKYETRWRRCTLPPSFVSNDAGLMVVASSSMMTSTPVCHRVSLV